MSGWARILAFALAVMPIMFATKMATWPAVVVIGIAGAAHQARLRGN